MATYPGAVYAPSVKANGQTIQASWFNDPDAEITAIEDALRNGISHAVTINAALTVGGALSVSTGGATISTGSVNIGGPSSLATLQVNGASTFAGAVTFSAGITFGGAATFSDALTLSSGATVSTGVVRQNSLPSWSVYSTAALAVAAGASAGVSFDGQTFVRGSVAHSTSADSSRVTINTTGVYQISYTGHFNADGAAAGQKKVYLRVNDSTNLYRLEAGRNSSEAGRTLTFSHPFRIDSTGYLGIVIVSSGSSPSTHGGSAALDRIQFMGSFIG